jgi:uncharacterized Zn-binding protein involved in type VI secretion
MTMIVDGEPGARHGDKTVFRAILIAGQRYAALPDRLLHQAVEA